MKKLTMTMQEFYNEFSPLAKSEGIQYSFERNKKNMKVLASQEFCNKFNY